MEIRGARVIEGVAYVQHAIIGGSVQGKKGLLQNFELGGHKMDHIEVQFATEAKGVFANAYTDGNVGTGLLEPFVLVFDYQQTRMAFVKR